jgi:hypothetical protein
VQAIRAGEVITYDYVGDWDELMQESKPEIARKIETLKNRSSRRSPIS